MAKLGCHFNRSPLVILGADLLSFQPQPSCHATAPHLSFRPHPSCHFDRTPLVISTAPLLSFRPKRRNLLVFSTPSLRDVCCSSSFLRFVPLPLHFGRNDKRGLVQQPLRSKRQEGRCATATSVEIKRGVVQQPLRSKSRGALCNSHFGRNQEGALCNSHFGRNHKRGPCATATSVEMTRGALCNRHIGRNQEGGRGCA